MQEPLISKTTDGSKKHLIGKMVSKGNLDWMFQRLDVALLEGTIDKPTRVYLKIGKINKEDSDFRADKETTVL